MANHLLRIAGLGWRYHGDVLATGSFIFRSLAGVPTVGDKSQRGVVPGFGDEGAGGIFGGVDAGLAAGIVGDHGTGGIEDHHGRGHVTRSSGGARHGATSGG